MKMPGAFMKREIAEIPQVLGRLIATDRSSFASILKGSDHQITSIIIAARGTSDNAAHFLKYLIETTIGLPCGLASPSSVTLYDAPMRYESTLVVALSQSGQSTDLISYVDSARKHGALVLAITNDSASPLAKVADFHFFLGAGKEEAVPATKTYVAQLLACYLLVKDWNQETPRIENLSNTASQLLNREEECLRFISGLDINRPIYILGRGVSYPNAREFALKIQETCHIPVQSFSTSDFLHGPIASVDSGSQVLFLSPAHQPPSAFGEALEKVRLNGSSIYWIGCTELALSNEPCLWGAEAVDEAQSSICDAILFQMATYYLALKNGFDPDIPRGLTKVTLTV